MSEPSMQPASRRTPHADARIIVIGAGLAGLVVARDLARSGVRVTVIEASDRIGGQLAAIRIGGVEVDAAAESFATRGGGVQALVSELGMSADIVRPRESPAWVIGRRGRAHPLPASSVLGIPGDPRAHDVVRAVGMLAAWRARLDAIMPLRHPDSYRTVDDLVRRRMGAGILRHLVAPVVRGVYSTTPNALPLERASPGMRQALRESGSLGAAVKRLRAASPAGSQVAGIRGGVHRLATALEADARAAGAEILLGRRVTRFDSDGVWLQSGDRLDGRVVSAAAEVAGAGVRTRTITVATAIVDAGGLDDAPRGTGALVEERAAGITARAFTHSSAKWQWLADELPAHRHAVRLSYDEMPDDPEATVSADLQAIAGVRIERLVAIDLRTWTRTLEASPLASGQDVVGEAASVTGLATIIPAARATAARITTERISTGMNATGAEG